MTDHASILHRRAVRHFRAGNAQRWVACLAARRIVGNYDEGATAALASDLCLSVTQVHNLADAGRAYVAYRKSRQSCVNLRLSLTPSHFAAVYQLQARYGFDAFQATGFLSEAAEYGASVATMRQSVDGIYSTKAPPLRIEGNITMTAYRDGGVLVTVFCRDCAGAPEVGSAVRIVETKRRVEVTIDKAILPNANTTIR